MPDRFWGFIFSITSKRLDLQLNGEKLVEIGTVDPQIICLKGFMF